MPLRCVFNLRQVSLSTWAGLLFIAVLAFPYLLGHATPSPSATFSGIVRLVEDNNSYFAWAKQSQRGENLCILLYANEDQPRCLFLPFFFLVGRLARWTGWPLTLCMNLAQGAGVIFAVRQIQRWIGSETRDVAVQNLAMIFVLFGGGLGGFPFLKSLLGVAPADADFIHFTMFSSLFHYPFTGLATGLLFAGLRLFRRESPRPGRDAAFAGGLFALLFSIHPYDALIGVAVAAASEIAAPHPIRRPTRRLGLLFACLLPGLLPLAWAYAHNPVLRDYSAGVHPFPLTPAAWLLGLGPLLLFIPAALRARRVDLRRPPTLWALGGTLLLFLPLPFDNEFVRGLPVPFLLIAAEGAVRLFRSAPAARRWVARLGIGLCFAVGLPVHARIWWDGVQNVRRRDAPIFLPRTWTDAMNRLEREAPAGARVLTTRLFGLLVPPNTGCRAFVGHWDQTPHLAQRNQETERFFSTDATDEERDAFLGRNRIDYVLLTPRTRQGQEARWAAASKLRRFYENPDFTVLQVAP